MIGLRSSRAELRGKFQTLCPDQGAHTRARQSASRPDACRASSHLYQAESTSVEVVLVPNTEPRRPSRVSVQILDGLDSRTCTVTGAQADAHLCLDPTRWEDISNRTHIPSVVVSPLDDAWEAWRGHASSRIRRSTSGMRMFQYLSVAYLPM